MQSGFIINKGQTLVWSKNVGINNIKKMRNIKENPNKKCFNCNKELKGYRMFYCSDKCQRDSKGSKKNNNGNRT